MLAICAVFEAIGEKRKTTVTNLAIEPSLEPLDWPKSSKNR